MSKMLRLALVALVPLSLCACASVTEAVNGPKLTPISYPAAMAPTRQASLDTRDTSARPSSPNSLWRNGARAFFHDQRASKVGDVVTVQINIKDNATVQNETDTSRKSSVDNGVSHLFGLEKLLPSSIDPAHMVTTGSNTGQTGKGSVNRSEAISLTIAAVVTSVLPNGNMMIQGRQEVEINQEVRELTVAGIVRPEDIASDNTVQHTQIAEARVSYGGRGALTRVQKVPWGQAITEAVSPF